MQLSHRKYQKQRRSLLIVNILKVSVSMGKVIRKVGENRARACCTLDRKQDLKIVFRFSKPVRGSIIPGEKFNSKVELGKRANLAKSTTTIGTQKKSLPQN